MPVTDVLFSQNGRFNLHKRRNNACPCMSNVVTFYLNLGCHICIIPTTARSFPSYLPCSFRALPYVLPLFPVSPISWWHPAAKPCSIFAPLVRSKETRGFSRTWAGSLSEMWKKHPPEASDMGRVVIPEQIIAINYLECLNNGPIKVE